MVKSTMEVKATAEGCDAVIEFIAQQTEVVPFPNAQEIVVAAEELLLNIIQYAYEPGREGNILVECLDDLYERMFQLTIHDTGRPFDPAAWGEDTNVRVITCGKGSKGIGLLIVKRFMNRLQYFRENGQNVLIAARYY